MTSVEHSVVILHVRYGDRATAGGMLNLLYEAYILDGRGGVGWHRTIVEHEAFSEEQPILREEGVKRAPVESARQRSMQRQR
jgi:hypothetical protein